MVLLAVFATVVAIIFLSYAIPHVIVSRFCKPRDLKKAYDAEWALVTGASSGIGKSLADRLAGQGLNVVLVAVDDGLLRSTTAELRAKYPRVELKAVGVDLGRPGYVEVVSKALAGLSKPVQVAFLNAGYMLTGFFCDQPLERQLANLECNAASAVAISHVVLDGMLTADLRGCLVFTSSAAAAIPSPFSVLYAATKSFLSSFGAGLAAEVKSRGVDVLVVHPSPVASRFYDKAHKLDALEFFKRFAVSPDDLPDAIFSSIGRVVFRDVGPTAVIFRIIPKLIDYNFLATLMSRTGHWMPDFRRQIRASEAAKKDARKTR